MQVQAARGACASCRPCQAAARASGGGDLSLAWSKRAHQPRQAAAERAHTRADALMIGPQAWGLFGGHDEPRPLTHLAPLSQLAPWPRLAPGSSPAGCRRCGRRCVRRCTRSRRRSGQRPRRSSSRRARSPRPSCRLHPYRAPHTHAHSHAHVEAPLCAPACQPSTNVRRGAVRCKALRCGAVRCAALCRPAGYVSSKGCMRIDPCLPLHGPQPRLACLHARCPAIVQRRLAHRCSTCCCRSSAGRCTRSC